MVIHVNAQVVKQNLLKKLINKFFVKQNLVLYVKIIIGIIQHLIKKIIHQEFHLY